MKAVILAGGLGTRLRPVTGEHPKPMVPLLGRPVMEHIVELLRQNGYTHICAALHYRAGEIMAHFGDGRKFGVELEYRIETENLGTAGSVKNCRDFYKDEDFLVISGDAACDYANRYCAGENGWKSCTVARNLLLYYEREQEEDD